MPGAAPCRLLAGRGRRAQPSGDLKGLLKPGRPCYATYLQLLDILLERPAFTLDFLAADLRCALPLDVVLRLLLNQPDPFQHIRDVVDPAFLHLHQNDSNDPSMP